MRVKLPIIVLALVFVVLLAAVVLKFENEKIKPPVNSEDSQITNTGNSKKDESTIPRSSNAPKNRVVNTPVVYNEVGFEVDTITISIGQSVIIINKSKSLLPLQIKPAGNLLIESDLSGVTPKFEKSGVFEIKDAKKNKLQVIVKE